MKTTSVNFRLHRTFNNSRLLLTTSNYTFFSSKPEKSIYHPSMLILFPELNEKHKRSISQLGTPDYQRSVRRAFSRAKLLAFFNPDLTEFITLTYADNMQDTKQVIIDIKRFVQQTKRKTKQKPKYIYAIEKQKRGALHVHMIASKGFQYEINNHGYKQLKDWSKGFTNVQTISDFDKDFKTYLYLFKYMGKAQRVGSTFIHCSRGFDKITLADYRDYINILKEGDILYQEDTKFTIENRKCNIIKSYITTKDESIL